MSALLSGPIAARESAPTLLCFGDSLTAGYGLDDPAEAFPHRLADLAADAGRPLHVIPAGLSGETTAGGLRRIDWVLRPPRDWSADQPFRLDFFLLALGGNDGLRGISLVETERNLRGIVNKVRARYPEVRIVLAGMEMPVNWGEPFRDAYREVFRRVAETEDAVLIPFLLEGVGGVPERMQADQIHPNVEGHRRIAALVWQTLEPLLRQPMD